MATYYSQHEKIINCNKKNTRNKLYKLPYLKKMKL